MKFLRYILISLYVIKAYCSAHDHLKELISLLLLAGSNQDGNMAKDGIFDLKVNVSSKINKQIMLSIKDIIPNLRNGITTYKTLNDLAEIVYKTYFPDGSNPDDIINSYDIIHALTTSNNNGNNPVSLFTGTSNKNVFIISDLRQNKRLGWYIRDTNLGRNTDINNYYNPFSTSSHHNIEYSSRSDLFKAIAAQCIKDRRTCKDLYFYPRRRFRDNYSEITCYIVTNNDGNTIKHSFIINDLRNREVAHPFTLIENNINNQVSYSVDTSFSPNTLTYRQIENILGGYHKTYFTNRIRDPGIGIIFHSGINLVNQFNRPINNYYINDNELRLNIIGAVIGSNADVSTPEQIKPTDNIVCSKSNNYEYITLENIILKVLEERLNKKQISLEKIEKISNLAKMLAIIKMFPINSYNNFNGIVEDKNHVIEIQKTLSFVNKILNIINRNSICAFTKKRGENSCQHCTSLTNNFDITKSLLNTLFMIRDKKINANILLDEDFNIDSNDDDNENENIDNENDENYNNKFKNLKIKNLYKNAKKASDIWNDLIINYMNNRDEFSEDESKIFITNFNEFINGCKDEISKSENSNNNLIDGITEDDINEMEVKLKKIKTIHKTHNNKLLIDENGNEFVNELEYNSDSQSELYKNKLIENINNAYSLLNENNEEMHICMLFNFGKDDNKEFDEDRTEEIDLLLEDIDQMNINANDKEEFKNKLLYLYNEFDKLWNVFEEDNTNNDEIKNNSEIVLKLRNAFAKKLKKEYFNDNEIQSIQIIDESNIKSSNIINLDHLNVDKSNFIDYISNDINSKSYIKLFFDNMKIKVLMLDENQNELSESIYKDIKLLETNIMKKIQDMKSYSSAEGHYEEADHLLELISNYNELISVCIHENKVNDDGVTDIIKAIDIDSDDELKNRLKYIATKKENEGINKIFKENSDKFKNNENKEKFENYINTNGDDAIRFTFGNDSVNKGTLKDFNRLLKSPANSEGEAIVSIMENSSDEYGVSEISDSYKLKLGLIKCASPMSRDPKDIDDIATVSNKLIKISKNWSNIETYQEHNFRTFMNFLTSVNKYDDYAVGNVENVKNNEEGFIDLSSTYNNEENSLEINSYHDIFSNMNDLLSEINEFENSLNNDDKEQVKEQLNEIKSNIDNAMNELYKHIKGSKIKLSESAGRENSEQFNKAINEFNEISNGAKMLFKTHAKLRSDDNSNSSSNFESKLNSLSKISSIKNVNSKLGLKNKNKNKTLLMKKSIRKIKRFA